MSSMIDGVHASLWVTYVGVWYRHERPREMQRYYTFVRLFQSLRYVSVHSLVEDLLQVYYLLFYRHLFLLSIFLPIFHKLVWTLKYGVLIISLTQKRAELIYGFYGYLMYVVHIAVILLRRFTYTVLGIFFLKKIRWRFTIKLIKNSWIHKYWTWTI